MEALAKIQQELVAPKNLRNNFGKYNYRSCEGILEAVKPLLKQYGATLTLSDSTTEIAGIPVVNAVAVIKCGDESESVSAQAGVDVNRKGMDISQSFGASSSYARKYALNGLFLIDDTKDADATNKHGKDDKKQTLAEYKKEMKAAKDGSAVQAIAKEYSTTISDVWNKTDRDEAADIYQARIDDFVLAADSLFEKTKNENIGKLKEDMRQD